MKFKKTPKGYLVTSNNFEPGARGTICDLCKFENMPADVEPCNSCDDIMVEYSMIPKIKENPTAGWLTGWTCPRCGAGNSPFNSRCGCVPFEYKVTCGG